MSIDWKAGASLAEHINLRDSGKLVVSDRPAKCLGCEECGCFWAHGSYSRHLEEGGVSAEIKVARWKCRNCGSTESSQPPFAVPRCRYTVRVMGSGLDGYVEQLTTYRSEVAKLGEVGPSPSQLFQWVKWLARKASGLLVEVQGLCLTAGTDEVALLEAETRACPNGGKAIVPGKAKQLDLLAKLRSYTRVLFQDGIDFVFWCLSIRLLRHNGQQIFLRPERESSTPQRTKPRISEVF